MRILCDVDGVVCYGSKPYRDCKPFPHAVRYLQKLKSNGHTLIYLTARYMAVTKGDKDAAEKLGLAELTEWMDRHKVPYDEIHFGKPSAQIHLDDLAFKIVSANGCTDWDRLMSFLELGDPNRIAVGDVVQLRSGGPAMTALRESSEGLLELMYFDQDGDPIELQVPAGAISVVERRWTGLDEDDVSDALADSGETEDGFSPEEDGDDDSDLDDGSPGGVG